MISLKNLFGTHPVIAQTIRQRALKHMDAGRHDEAFQIDPTLGEGFYSDHLNSWAHENKVEMSRRVDSHMKNYDYLYYPPESLERTNHYSNGGNPLSEKTKITHSPVSMSDEEKKSFWKKKQHIGKEIIRQQEFPNKKSGEWTESLLDRPNGDIRFVRKGQGQIEIDRHGKGIDPSAETVVNPKVKTELSTLKVEDGEVHMQKLSWTNSLVEKTLKFLAGDHEEDSLLDELSKKHLGHHGDKNKD